MSASRKYLTVNRRLRIQVIRVFVPVAIEGVVSLTPKGRFLLAPARFEPKKEAFSATSVSRSSEPLTKPGVPLDLRARYYQVASDRNGAIEITEKNSWLIEEIRTAIRRPDTGKSSS